MNKILAFGKYLAEKGWKPYGENVWENSDDDTASTETIYSDFISTYQQSLPSNPVGDVEEMNVNKIGDVVLTELKKDPNHITKLLNKDEETSYNTGFHTGFKSGYAAAPQKGMEFVEWQLCPKCNGDGNLARYNSPSIIGTDAALLCDICKGAKMIPKIALDESPSPSEEGDGWDDEDWIKFIQWYDGMNRSSVLQGINQYKSQTPDQ